MPRPQLARTAPQNQRYTHKHAHKKQTARGIQEAKNAQEIAQAGFTTAFGIGNLHFDPTNPAHILVFSLLAFTALAPVAQAAGAGSRAGRARPDAAPVGQESCSVQFGVSKEGKLAFADGSPVVDKIIPVNDNCTIVINSNLNLDRTGTGARRVDGDITVHIIDKKDNCCSMGMRVTKLRQPEIFPSLGVTQVTRDSVTGAIQSVQFQPITDRKLLQQCDHLQILHPIAGNHVAVVQAGAQTVQDTRSAVVRDLTAAIQRLEVQKAREAAGASASAQRDIQPCNALVVSSSGAARVLVDARQAESVDLFTSQDGRPGFIATTGDCAVIGSHGNPAQVNLVAGGKDCGVKVTYGPDGKPIITPTDGALPREGGVMHFPGQQAPMCKYDINPADGSVMVYSPAQQQGAAAGVASPDGTAEMLRPQAATGSARLANKRAPQTKHPTWTAQAVPRPVDGLRHAAF